MAVENIFVDLPPDVITLFKQNGIINKDGVIEAVTRGKYKRLNTFYHIGVNSANKAQLQEKAGQLAALLNKNHAESIKMLSNITKLSQFTMVLSGLNLCATAAGFAIMNAKLDKMSSKINEVIRRQKEAVEINANYEIGKVISSHTIMLDHRRTQNYFSEEQMEELVAKEYDALCYLMDIVSKEATGNNSELIFYMLSMASMLAVSLKYYDEIYYFKNKDTIVGESAWHSNHEKWVAVFNTLTDTEMIEMIQDCGYFDMDLNTVENDCFYKSYKTQISQLKQEIEDNQLIIQSLNDPELFMAVRNMVRDAAKEEIETALQQVGINPKDYEKTIQVAVAQ